MEHTQVGDEQQSQGVRVRAVCSGMLGCTKLALLRREKLEVGAARGGDGVREQLGSLPVAAGLSTP